jgi:ADP-ribose pyrophosphatase
MSAEIHDDEKVYKGFLKVHKQIIQHESFSGGDMIVTREVIKGNNAVGLILYDSILKKVLLIRQFRVGSFDWMLEIVAGLNDKNENEIDLVIREAKEEAGVDVKQITKVVEYFVNPGNSTDKVTIYAGLFDSTKVVDNSVHGLEIEGEDIRIELYTINEIKKMMKNGLLNSAMTIISMNWLINNV